jgi:hypothetical protein
MKILSFTACVLLAVAFHAGAQAPIGPGAVKVGKISPEVVKTPEFTLKSGSEKRSKLGDWLEIEVEYETKAEEIDELTFQFTVMLENKLLDGQVTYITIPKGRDHYAVVYIAPRTLEKLTGGKPFTAANIQNVWVIVTKSGQNLDQAAVKNVAIPNLPHTNGLILNKSETPFAPLYFDRYEAIKPGK